MQKLDELPKQDLVRNKTSFPINIQQSLTQSLAESIFGTTETRTGHFGHTRESPHGPATVLYGVGTA